MGGDKIVKILPVLSYMELMKKPLLFVRLRRSPALILSNKTVVKDFETAWEQVKSSG